MVDELNVELLFAKTAYTKRHLLKGARVKFKNYKKILIFWILSKYILQCVVTGGCEGRFQKG